MIDTVVVENTLISLITLTHEQFLPTFFLLRLIKIHQKRKIYVVFYLHFDIYL